MSNSITDFLAAILSAKYGEQVRGAIHDAIELCYQDGKAGVNDLEARHLIEQVIGVNEMQDAGIETLAARVEALEQGGEGESAGTTTTTVPTFIVDSGIVNFSNVQANKTATETVTFSKTFTEAPVVVCIKAFRNAANTFYSQVTAQPILSSITTTGCTLAVGNRYTQAVSPSVLWIAFQPTEIEINTEIIVPSGDGMTEAEVIELLAPISAALNGIKTGYDGTVYDTPGEAVREQINDLHVLIGDEPGTAIAGSAVSYDGTSSALSATNVQAAIDETNEKFTAVNGRLQEYEDIFTGDVDESVQNWLDEHPEATTTVQDGSLTFAKLVNGTLGFVTPEMYGAVGNGSANDTQAIQDAVDSGRPIYFDKSYAVTGEITVSGSCVLIGNPKGYIKQTTNNTNLFVISGNDVTVDSLHLIGVGTDYQPTAGGKTVPYGIAIRGQADARLKRIKVVNCVVEKFSHADISVVYADDVTIESNTVVGTGVDGSISLMDNYQFGIHANNCSGLRIVGNDVSYTAHGLYLGKNIYDLIVNGNTIHDIPGQHGIYSTFANGYMLTNNTFRNIALAGCKIQHDDQITEDSRNILIQGNLFDTVGQQAFMTTTVETTPTYLFTGVNVLGNMFYNCEVGVFAARCRDIKIADNVYIGATKKTAGISLGASCQRISIQNNKITNSDNGIYARTGATISEIVMNGNVLKNAGVSFSGATSVTDLIYVNNIADAVGGFPNQIIIGKNKNKNLYYAPDTAIDTGSYDAGDMVLFNNAQSLGYVGAIKNATGGWAFLGNCLEHIKYIFSETGTGNWTINSFSAHSEGEHKLVITWSITCNVRGSAKTIGSFAGIPSGLLPDSNLYLSTSENDGYGLYINANGQVAASTGTVNATYTKTVTLVDGAISQ